jgi:hypothetical protein
MEARLVRSSRSIRRSRANSAVEAFERRAEGFAHYRQFRQPGKAHQLRSQRGRGKDDRDHQQKPASHGSHSFAILH